MGNTEQNFFASTCHDVASETKNSSTGPGTKTFWPNWIEPIYYIALEASVYLHAIVW